MKIYWKSWVKNYYKKFILPSSVKVLQLTNQVKLVSVLGSKRDFTPRLGRESGEESLNAAPSAYSGEKWYQENELPTDLMSQRSPPFAPRLGRHLYIPRLGRKLEKLVV